MTKIYLSIWKWYATALYKNRYLHLDIEVLAPSNLFWWKFKSIFPSIAKKKKKKEKKIRNLCFTGLHFAKTHHYHHKLPTWSRSNGDLRVRRPLSHAFWIDISNFWNVDHVVMGYYTSYMPRSRNSLLSILLRPLWSWVPLHNWILIQSVRPPKRIAFLATVLVDHCD